MPDLNDIKNYLKNYSGEKKIIMEVCGTHTAAISENGISGMLSPEIRLVSGPGCPVCVTVASYVDRLTELSTEKDTTVMSFGDMLRVRGSAISLRDAKAAGGSVKMVYSPFEIINEAIENPDRKFVFAAIGFETTTPVYALIVDELIKKGIKNVRLLTALKTMPPAIRKLAEGESPVTGFLAPGHVSTITGHRLFEDLSKELNIPFVTAGFKGGELLAAIYALTKLHGGKALNMYPSAVTYEGNTEANRLVNKYFEPCDAAWRGMGIINNSGMCLKSEYSKYDAGSVELTEDNYAVSSCRCGDVISGRINPRDCPVFSVSCTPETPQGACMISSEGSCFHYYINGR